MPRDVERLGPVHVRGATSENGARMTEEEHDPPTQDTRDMILDAVYGWGLAVLVSWAIGFFCGRYL